MSPFVFFLCMIVALPCRATSLLVVRTAAEAVYVAADSRLGTQADDGSTRHDSLTCKIEQLSPDQFAAFSGTVFAKAYDARIIAKQAVDPSDPIRTVANFQQAIQPSIEKTAKAVVAETKINPLFKKEYGYLINGDAPFLSTVFLARVDGNTRLFFEEFQVAFDGSNIRVNSRDRTCPGETCPNGEIYADLGDHHLPGEERHSIIYGAPNIPTGMIALMEKERKFFPAEIAPPYVVLSVDFLHARWVGGRHGVCEDLK
jgi:hypothetical protein